MDFNNQPLVSTIITTYKRPTFLKRAITSALNQTYKNIEVVVVDDNGDDSKYRTMTEDCMKEFKTDQRVVYVKHRQNLNGAVARNTGIKYAKGEIVCFLDDDDFFHENKILRQVDYLLHHKEYRAVYCGRNTNKTPTVKGDLSFDLLAGTNLVYTSTIMMWKNAAVKCGGWDESFKRNQEAAFLLRYFRSGYKIGVISDALVEFDLSDRSNALISDKNREQMDHYLKSYSDIIDKLSENNYSLKKIIYSYRYRGVLLGYLKNKEFIKAFKLYCEFVVRMPLRFNYDLALYFFNRLFL